MSLEKTKCIVLHSTKYKDNISIVHLYSEKHGRISCFLPTRHSKKSNVKANLFQPLSILDVELAIKKEHEISQIKEAKILFSLVQIYTNPIKSAIAIFVAEFVYRMIREKEQNRPLFEFIENSIQILEWTTVGISNFHIVFLLKFTKHIGIFPNAPINSNQRYFDLINGNFTEKPPQSNQCLNEQKSKALSLLLKMNYQNMSRFRLNRDERYEIITQIFEYYKLHLTSFPTIKSLDVLKSLF